MIRKAAASLTILALSLAATSAWAQTDTETREITFVEGIDIEGNRIGPDGVVIQARGDAIFGDLVELRQSFVAEIVTSAEEIR